LIAPDFLHNFPKKNPREFYLCLSFFHIRVERRHTACVNFNFRRQSYLTNHKNQILILKISMRTEEFWKEMEEKVVGSSIEEQENVWKWIVDFNGNCVGNLISSQMVLTTALCCSMTQSNFVFVGGFGARKSGVRRTIESKHISPDFNQAKMRNDLCLVKLVQGRDRQNWIGSYRNIASVQFSDPIKYYLYFGISDPI
jgi:hypothetical protein